jgi:hypothetical protein
MNVTVNKDGTRNRDYRPYIDQEEQSNNLYLYDPNGNGFHYGLYGSNNNNNNRVTCGSWLDIYNQFPSKGIPASTIDRTGRVHLMRPSWATQDNLNYQKLNKHTKPSS